MIVALDTENIEYTLRTHPRSRSLRLTIYPGGKIIVTKPARYSDSQIEYFIKKKQDWILKKLKYFRELPERPKRKNTRQEYLKYKEQTRNLVKDRIKYWNTFYEFNFNRISIKNQKTLWGSCSRRGNLNFNYKLALLPLHLADYIIVHEICHLKEMNHSKRFWNLVAKTIPNYKAMRKELKKSNAHLF